MMTDFMEPLTLSKKSPGELFYDNIQKYTFFIKERILLILFIHLLIVY